MSDIFGVAFTVKYLYRPRSTCRPGVELGGVIVTCTVCRQQLPESGWWAIDMADHGRTHTPAGTMPTTRKGF